MKRLICVLALSGLAAAGEWAETVPVLEPGAAPCFVSGFATWSKEQEFWFRLGYKGPDEFLFVAGHLDDGTPLLVASARGAFLYDPLRGLLLDVGNLRVKFWLGVEEGAFGCGFAEAPAVAEGSLEFRIDLRSLARGLAHAERVDTGRRAGLAAKGTYLSFWTASEGAISRVAAAGASYRCDVSIGGDHAASLDAKALASLRQASTRATPAELDRLGEILARAYEVLPLFRNAEARAKVRKLEGTDLGWPALLEAHARTRSLLDAAIGAGPAFGGYHDGVALATRGDLAGALVRWREAVAAGDTRCMYTAGRAILFGRDLGEPAEGFDWMRRSADAGYPPAFALLGLACLRGLGCERDFGEAARWLGRAVDCGDARARYELGWMHVRGQGVERDTAPALALWKDAAAQGYAPAMNSLGLVLEYGRGVEADPAAAAEWYKRAADLGHVEAMMRLAVLHDRGRGVPEDKERAFALYERAAAGGQPYAQYVLAQRYDRGMGVERDRARARELLVESARGRYAFAQLVLARAYLAGSMGFPQSVAHGAAWLRVAADGGNEEARKQLAELEPTFSQAQRTVWHATLAQIEKELR